ncbi:hypothetical protein Bpfe_005990 [Biomphalaria pfeifferi]|uniref:Uncharacterized protein n=1 Tax=Biomphalaria pfeifferi TaxID=112525 RepID=A0AAD8C0P0_BIOPF|nr:hypothetical protein Bpfe_005990 [Biomphalaria pfeifferi]
MGQPDTYNEGTETFINYKERLDAYFQYSIGEKGRYTISLHRGQTLCYIKVIGISRNAHHEINEELCKLLNNHYSLPSLEIMERFKFHNKIQEDYETINEFITAIKALSEHCNLGPALQDSFRDRFVCCLKDVNIQKIILQEANLTSSTAINIAIAMETAKRDAEQIQSNQAKSLHRMQTKKEHIKS